jgi:hypothetical protein
MFVYIYTFVYIGRESTDANKIPGAAAAVLSGYGYLEYHKWQERPSSVHRQRKLICIRFE